jgi:arylsulfatase A-like enzyme
MKHCLSLLLAIVPLSSIAYAHLAHSSHPDKDDRPNIIFFIADDMLPRHFNCLPQGKGKQLTPNLDRLAAEGTLMLEQHVVSPICTPSRYNVLTGNFGSRAQNPWFKQTTQKAGQTIVEFNTHIMPNDSTLPRRLKASGYNTGMVGKNHVVEVHGLKKFPDFNASAKDPANQAQLKANHDHICQAMREVGFDFADSVYHNNPDFLGLRDVAVQNMDWITDAGVRFLKQPRNNPFFLYFSTTVPHGPTQAKRSWQADPRMTAIGYLDQAPTVQPARASIPTRLQAAGLPVTDDTANLLWLDDALGALLDTLEANGTIDNTIIFFFNDHGQRAKGTVYQGGVKNPSLVWRKGGFPVGSNSRALVSNIDFAPTILDFARVEYSPQDFDGQSFLPELYGTPQIAERTLYFELGYARALRIGDWKYMALRYPQHIETMSLAERSAVLNEWNENRRRRHLNIVTEDPNQPFSHLTAIPGGGDAEKRSTGSYPAYFERDQLYNLAQDPNEQNNLAQNHKYTAQLERMQNALQAQLETLPGGFGELKRN